MIRWYFLYDGIGRHATTEVVGLNSVRVQISLKKQFLTKKIWKFRKKVVSLQRN